MIYLNPRRESHQHEVTMSEENKNQNGKRITKTRLTGKKARKISRKKDNIEKLKKIPEATSQQDALQNWSFAGISEQQHMPLHRGKVI